MRLTEVVDQQNLDIAEGLSLNGGKEISKEGWTIVVHNANANQRLNVGRVLSGLFGHDNLSKAEHEIG